MTSTDYTVLDVPSSWCPPAPTSDDRAAADAVLNDVLSQSMSFTEAVIANANRHVNTAPASCAHASELSAIVSRTIVDWICRWPS